MIFRTARWRLVAWNVVVFGILLLIIEATAYGVFRSRIYSGVDSELRHQEDRVVSQLDNNSAAYAYSPFSYFNQKWSSFPAGFRVVTADPQGQVNQTIDCPNPQNYFIACYGTMSSLSEGGLDQIVRDARSYAVPWSPHDQLLSTLDDTRNVNFNHQPWRVLTFAVLFENRPIGIFQISRAVSGEVSALQELRVLLLFAGVFSILLATSAGIFLADRALVPIRQAFARQRQFTADASHELRTPLALIRAHAEMLFRHANTADGELIGEIIRETDHLNRLVGDLLTLARADAESLKVVARPVDFRTLVAGVSEDLRTIADSRGIGTNVSLNGPVMVQGDEGRLRQLLLILLDNALKYTDPGGRVDVSVLRQDNRARLVVQDTGIGIPASDLPHIFERFYRVDRAREHESGGTGLGLSIARWIVQAHHGNIKVESEAGKGARFQVDLPSI